MKIILTDDFFDCQVRNGLIYLWDTLGMLIIVDIRQLVLDQQKHYRGNITFELNRELINNYTIYAENVEGGIFPMDTIFVGNHLYTATETGLYKRYINGKEKRRQVSKNMSKKLLGMRLFELASGINETMAMAAGKEGVLEMYNPNKMRVSKWSHPLEKEIEYGIYLVHKNDSRSVMYEEQDILSIGKTGVYYRMNFRPIRKTGKKDVLIRAYKNTKEIKDIPAVLRIPEEKKQLIEEKKLPVTLTVSTQIRKRLDGQYGVAYVSKQQVVADTIQYGIKTIWGPITRCRTGSGFGGRNNLLITVLDDRVEITDFMGEEEL